MKKRIILLAVIAVSLMLLVSCRGEPADTAAALDTGRTSPLSPRIEPPEDSGGAETYGDDWRLAKMDRQILADDEYWSLTGKDFVYRGGYMGTGGSGFFDLCTNFIIGGEENYVFEFEYSAGGESALILGLGIDGADSLPGDGGSGIWLVFGSDGFGVYGKDGKITASLSGGFTQVSVRADQARGLTEIFLCGKKAAKIVYTPDGCVALYNENGVKLSETNAGTVCSGGYIKLRSAQNRAVYIRNAAFRFD